MNKSFIVNFVGQASPSSIKQLAAITHENEGKWLISKINFIESQVAGVIKIELPLENEAVVKDAFRNNANFLVQFVDSDNSTHNEDELFTLRVDSNDRAGIVNDITNVLDQQEINVVDIDCQRVFIAGGGGVSSGLFTASLVIQLPAQININDVVCELESLAEDIKVTKLD